MCFLHRFSYDATGTVILDSNNLLGPELPGDEPDAGKGRGRRDEPNGQGGPRSLEFRPSRADAGAGTAPPNAPELSNHLKVKNAK